MGTRLMRVRLSRAGFEWADDSAQTEREGAIPLPITGETVTLADPLRGTVRGVWLGLDERFPAGADYVLALVLTGSVVVELMVKREDVNAARVVDLWQESRVNQPELLALAALAKERAHARRDLDALVSDAHEWADDNDLCHRFDDFMEAHNLPTREREFTLRVRASVTVTITKQARNFDDAEDMVCRDDVIDALTPYDVEIDEIEED